MPLTDEDAALQAIASLENLSDQQTQALDAINKILQNSDPFVDVHELFGYYNTLYFRRILLPRVEVLWSPRLTLCAGICELSKDPMTGNFTRIRLKLSSPLLQYRPRSDTINTLLHEAIHAYFFITTSWRHSRGEDGTGHGAGFQLLADAINNHGQYEITIYHTFHDEVESFRTHVWQCDGVCKNQPPYFGLVKRSMNRPPGKNDSWWSTHESECGGTYTKIREPAPTKKQMDAMSKKQRAGLQKSKLDDWIKKRTPEDKDSVEEGNTSSGPANGKRKVSSSAISDGHMIEQDTTDQKRQRTAAENTQPELSAQSVVVECPICKSRIPELDINGHLDVNHPI